MTKDKLEKLFEYWLAGAKEDLESSKDVAYKAKRLSHALFFIHLSTEKILKAYYVKVKNEHAPYSHNLLLLANKADLVLLGPQQELLSKVNEFNLEARYPENVEAWKEQITEEFCTKYIEDVEEFHQWILTKLKSMP